MKAYRVIEYDGPEDWVQTTLAQSLIGKAEIGPGKFITATIVTAKKPISSFKGYVNSAKKRAVTWFGHPSQQSKLEPKLIVTPEEFVEERRGTGIK